MNHSNLAERWDDLDAGADPTRGTGPNRPRAAWVPIVQEVQVATENPARRRRRTMRPGGIVLRDQGLRDFRVR